VSHPPIRIRWPAGTCPSRTRNGRGVSPQLLP